VTVGSSTAAGAGSTTRAARPSARVPPAQLAAGADGPLEGFAVRGPGPLMGSQSVCPGLAGRGRCLLGEIRRPHVGGKGKGHRRHRIGGPTLGPPPLQAARPSALAERQVSAVHVMCCVGRDVAVERVEGPARCGGEGLLAKRPEAGLVSSPQAERPQGAPPSAAPGSSAPGNAIGMGSAEAFALADHKHGHENWSGMPTPLTTAGGGTAGARAP